MSARRIRVSGAGRLTSSVAWACSCLLALTGAAHAAPFTWSGAASSTATWTIDATNWTNATGTPWDAANGPTNVSVFNSASGTAVVTDQVYTNGLTFSAANGLVTGGTVTLSGTGVLMTVATGTSTLASTVTGSGFSKQGTGTLILSASNTFGSGTMTFGTGASTNLGYITMANGRALGNYSTINLAGNNTAVAGLNLTGGITANYPLRLDGRTDNGTSYHLKNLSGNNTWAGNITAVNTGGSYIFTSDSGTMTLSGTQNSSVTSGRAFVYNGAGGITITGPILNGGTAGISVNKNGTGTLTLAGSNSYALGTAVNAGTVSVTNASGLGVGSVTVSSAGTLNLNAVTVASGTSTFTVNGGGILGGSFGVNRLVGTSSGTVSTTLTGTAGLTKSGSGRLLLSGTTTFTGTTLVSGGTLALGNAVALQNSGFNTASTGVLQLASGTAVTLGGLVGSGTFNPVNYGTISSLTLNAQPGSTFTYSGNLANGAAGMSLTKSGSTVASVAAPGVQILSGTSLYTGPTTITGGVLQFAKPASLYAADNAKWTAANLTTGSGGALAVNVGGTGEFAAGDVATLLALATSTSGFLPGAAIGLDTTNAGGSFTYASAIADGNGGANSLGLVKLGSGTLALTAPNTYTGATTVAGGSVVFSGAGSLPTASAGWFVTGSGATLDVSNLTGPSYTPGSVGVAAGGTLALGSNAVTFGAAAGSSIAGTVTGNGGLTYTGTSALALSSSNGYAGPITLAAGALAYLQSPYGLGDAAVGTTLADGSQIYLLTSANAAPIPEPITFASGTATLRSGNAAAFTLSGSMTLGATASINNDTGSTITFVGPVSGSSGFVHSGGGTLALTNTTSANTFSGGISQAGTGGITIGAAGSQGTGDITFAPGGSGNLTFANVDGVIANNIVGGGGTGGVTKSGTGITALTGINTYTGTTTVSGGGLRIDSAAALPAGSTVALPKTGTSTGSLVLNVAGTTTISNTFAPFNSSNGLANGGTPNIQNLQGSNTITADMTIAAGGGNGINFTSDGGLLTLAGTLSNSVASSTRLMSLGGSGQGVVSGQVVNGTAAGAVTNLIKTGLGTWSLTNAANSFTGTPAILDGVLDAASLNDSGVASAIGAGTTIQFTGQGTSGTLRYTGATDQATNRTLQIDATGGAIDSSGAGALTFTGAVTATDPATLALNFTSGTNVATNTAVATPGTVVGQRFTSPAVSGTVTITAISGNTYTLSSPAILTGGSTATFVGATDRTLRLVGTNTGSNTVASALADSAGGGRLGVTKAGPGTWALTGPNSYTGPTTVAAGSLVIGPSSSLASSGTVTVAAGATLDVTAVAGGLVRTAGQTLAGGGLVAGSVVVNSGAVLSPGSSVGTLAISQDLSLAADGNYNWQMLNATGTAGGGWDLITPATLTLSSLSAGTPFNVNLWSLASANPDVNGNAANFDASTPGSWRILTSGAAIGGFDPSLFRINTLPTAGAAGFSNPLLGGTFSLALSNDSLGIDLMFTPATPYTWYGNGTTPGGSGTWTGVGLTWNDGSSMAAWDPTRNARFDTTGGTVTIAGSQTAGNGLNFVVDGYTIAGDGLALTAANRATNAVNVATGATATFANAVTAANGFAKTGPGRMLAVGDITATGGVTVAGGTLAIGNGGTAGTLAGDATVSAGAVLIFDRADAVTYGGSLSGDGVLQKQGAGLLTLAGTGSPTGGVVLAAGTVGLGSADALGSTGTISFTGGGLQFSAANTADYSARFSAAAGQAYRLDTNGQVVSLGSGLASPDGSLTKLGDGTLVLAGLNTYSGTTTIAAGALQLGNGAAGGSVAGPIVNSGTLVLNRSDAVALGNAVSGSGLVRKLAANTVTISSSNSWSGGTALEQGNLQVNASGALGSGTVTITNAGGNTRLLLGGSTGTTLANPIVVSGVQNPGVGNGVISVTSGTATITGPMTLDNAPTATGGMLSTSAGATLVITAPITVTGASADFSQRTGNVIMSGTGSTGWGIFGVTGTLSNAATDALCTTATLRLGPSGAATYNLAGYDQTLATLTSTTVAAVVANSSTTTDSTLTVVGGTGAYLGTIADSVFGGTRKVNLVVGAGATFTLSGNNTFTGFTRIVDGTLALSAANALAGSTLDMNATDVGALSLSATAATTFNIGALTGSRGIDVGIHSLAVGGNGQSTTYAGVVTGAGGLTKSGTGTMLVTATQTYAGPTSIGGGTLRISSNNQFVTSSTLAFTGSNATFDIGSTSQTFGALSSANNVIADGMAVTGSGGALAILGPGNMEVGPGGAVSVAGARDSLSLAAISSFTYVNTSGTARVGLKGGATNSAAPGTSSLTLANSNTITAAFLGVADVSASNDGGSAQLILGQSNAFSIGTFAQSSAGRSDSAVRFNTGLTNPSLVLRGTDGSSPIGSWTIGSVAQFGGAGKTSFTSTADFSAGTLDAKVTTLTIAQANTATQTSRTGVQTSVFTMGSGTLDAASIVVGRITGALAGSVATGTYAANGTLTIASPSALVRATSLTLAENTILGTGTTGSYKAVSGTVNLSAGTLLAGSIARGAQTGNADSVSATINWTGGTIGNLDGSDLTIDTVPITLASGTGTFLASGTGTITANAGAPISGAGSLVKAGPGTVRLAGNATYGGSTQIDAGVLAMASGSLAGAVNGSGQLVKTGTGTLVLAGAGSLTGSTTIEAGVLRLANGAALASSAITPLAGGTLAITPYLLTTVGGLAPNAGGLTDVGSGLMTVSAGLSAADLVTALLTGRGDGSWSGTSGITSSQAAADIAVSIPRTVGWLDNGDGSVTFAFAAAGDTNLDWSVDILDAANFLAGGKFDSGLPASWNEGDFGYDGLVDILDAADFLSTGLFDAGAYNPPPGIAGGIAAVPEPTVMPAALVALGVVGLALRRRWRV